MSREHVYPTPIQSLPHYNQLEATQASRTWRTYMNYSVPLAHVSDKTLSVKDIADRNQVSMYSDDVVTHVMGSYVNAAPFSVHMDVPKFDPTVYYHGVEYTIPALASQLAGFLYMHIEPSLDLSFVLITGLADIISNGTYAEITANGKKVPCILYNSRTNEEPVTMVLFEKGTFNNGGVVEIHIHNAQTYGLRMNFVRTLGSYITFFRENK